MVILAYSYVYFIFMFVFCFCILLGFFVCFFVLFLLALVCVLGLSNSLFELILAITLKGFTVSGPLPPFLLRGQP